MSHEVVGRGTVPVPLAGRRVDRVAGADFDDFAAAGLDPPDAIYHVQRLADSMGMPRIPRPRREPDDVDADAGRLLASRDDIDPDIAGEDVGAALRGRHRGSDLHHAALPTRTSDFTARRSSIAE